MHRERQIRTPTQPSSRLYRMKPQCRAFPSLRRFNFAIPRRCVGYQRIEKFSRDLRYLLDRVIESGFVGFGRLSKSAELSDKLNC